MKKRSTTLSKWIIFALCLLALPLPSPAHAQDEDISESMTYDHTGSATANSEQMRNMQKRSMGDRGYIYPDKVEVSITHQSYMEDNQFGLQMSVPDLVSGCFKFSPLEYEANFVDPYFLDIKIKRYRRTAPEGVEAQKQCDSGNKMATALMVLDKEDLIKRGTKEIRFSTTNASDTYKIIIDDAHVELIAKSMMAFRVKNTGGEKDRLSYSFSSDKTVALYVPMARPGEDFTQQIIEFARNRAMTPLAEGSVAWGGNGLATYYFEDNTGHILAQIGEKGYADVGKISVNRAADGATGRTDIPVSLSVFVTRPGTQL